MTENSMSGDNISNGKEEEGNNFTSAKCIVSQIGEDNTTPELNHDCGDSNERAPAISHSFTIESDKNEEKLPAEGCTWNYCVLDYFVNDDCSVATDNASHIYNYTPSKSSHINEVPPNAENTDSLGENDSNKDFTYENFPDVSSFIGVNEYHTSSNGMRTELDISTPLAIHDNTFENGPTAELSGKNRSIARPNIEDVIDVESFEFTTSKSRKIDDDIVIDVESLQSDDSCRESLKRKLPSSESDDDCTITGTFIPALPRDSGRLSKMCLSLKGNDHFEEEKEDLSVVIDKLFGKLSCPVCFRNFRRPVDIHPKMNKSSSSCDFKTNIIHEDEFGDASQDDLLSMFIPESSSSSCSSFRENFPRRSGIPASDSNYQSLLDSGESFSNEASIESSQLGSTMNLQSSSSPPNLENFSNSGNIEELHLDYTTTFQYDVPKCGSNYVVAKLNDSADHTTDSLAVTRCGHVFCQTCIKEALRIRKQCPLCRKFLRASQWYPLFL